MSTSSLIVIKSERRLRNYEVYREWIIVMNADKLQLLHFACHYYDQNVDLPLKFLMTVVISNPNWLIRFINIIFMEYYQPAITIKPMT